MLLDRKVNWRPITGGAGARKGHVNCVGKCARCKIYRPAIELRRVPDRWHLGSWVIGYWCCKSVHVCKLAQRAAREGTMDKKQRQAIEKGKKGEPGKKSERQASKPVDKPVDGATPTGESKPQTVNALGAMPKLPKLPAAARAPRKKPTRECTCGCGGTTTGMWVPGHDARAKGWAIRIERNVCTMTDVPVNERKGAKFYLDVRKAQAEAGAGTTSKIKLVKKNGDEGQGANLGESEAAPAPAVGE